MAADKNLVVGKLLNDFTPFGDNGKNIDLCNRRAIKEAFGVAYEAGRLTQEEIQKENSIRKRQKSNKHFRVFLGLLLGWTLVLTLYSGNWPFLEFLVLFMFSVKFIFWIFFHGRHHGRHGHVGMHSHRSH